MTGPAVVAVTAHRPHEVATPLRRVDPAAEIVAIDPSVGFVRRNIETVRRTHRALRTADPDLVLYDCRALLGTLVTLVSLAHGVDTVFRFKGNHWRGLAETYRPERGDGGLDWFRYALTRLLDRFNYAMAEGFVVVSTELKWTVARRTGRPPDLIQVVHVPSNPHRGDGSASAARRRLGVEADSVVLTVTNLDYRGKLEGIEAVARGMEPVLRRTGTDVAYIVAGGGRYHDDLLAFLDGSIDPSVRSRMFAPGFVEPVEDLYALADVFVYVSHIDGYPNAVLEAQQAGLPVVVNAAHGMVEQVEHGRTGVVLDQVTPDAVAAHVGTLLDDPAERARLGRAGRRRVAAENDPAVIGRRLFSALERIHESG